jgi:hypothetical protein
LPVVKPKHEMTEREHHPRQAFAVVREELMLDGDIRCRNKEFVFALALLALHFPLSKYHAELRLHFFNAPVRLGVWITYFNPHFLF